MSVRIKGKEYETYKYEGKNCLYLRGIGISQLNEIERLENLDQLDILNLSFNRLSVIKGLEKLKNLIYLNLRGNIINNIADIYGLSEMGRLKNLNLSENRIIEIQGLEELSELKILDLSKNHIKRVSGIESNNKLEELNLSNNRIRYIENLDNLMALKSLNLSHNNIFEISGLENLENLKDLNLEDNRIIKLKGLQNLSKLESLNLRKNDAISKERILLGEVDEDGYAPIGFTPMHYVRYCALQDLLNQDKKIDTFLEGLLEDYKQFGFGDLLGSDNVWWWIYRIGFHCIDNVKFQEAQLIGDFLMKFGKDKNNQKILYCAKNLMASICAQSNDPIVLKKGKDLFEEIKEAVPAWTDYYLSKSNYEMIINKLHISED
jgi:Leucine-rich repeat (LRR) protein